MSDAGTPGAGHPMWNRQENVVFRFVVPCVLAAIALILLVSDPFVFQLLRNAQFDLFQRWQPRAYVDAPVKIIDIDDESLQRLGQWPWPRTQIARLVDTLRDGGAAAIGFDVVFAEPDRTSPESISRLWQLDEGLAHRLSTLPRHDEVLAEQLRPGGVVLGFALEDTQAAGGAESPGGDPPYRFIMLGGTDVSALHSFSTAIRALPALEAAAAGRGALTFVPDSDGVVRRLPLVLRLRGELIPTLVAEVLRVGQDEINHVLTVSAERGVGLEAFRSGQISVPTTANGEIWIHYSEPVPERYIPAWRVLTGEVDAATLAGNIVLVGASAKGLKDLRFSPLGRTIPGVEVHAQALEQILTGRALSRPSWALALELIVLALCIAIVSLLAARGEALIAAALTAIGLAALAWGGWVAFADHGLLLNVIVPMVLIAAAFMLTSLIHHFYSESEQRWIKSAFSRYVSPNLVDYLVEHPGELGLGGARRDCSFVFTDLADFTGMMERIELDAAVSMLNGYIDGLIAIAFRHEGTLDRIVGDAVVIMFSAPVVQADHCERAVNCALEMDTFAQAYSRRIHDQGGSFGITRIGVHTGSVIVGNFGGSTIFDYRALGDPVNTASRLEGANKYLGTRVCLSAATLAGCPGRKARPVGRLLVQGKTEALEVFEPETHGTENGRAPLKEYLASHACLNRDVDEARTAFQALHDRYPSDPLVLLFHQRLSEGQGGDLIVLEGK